MAAEKAMVGDGWIELEFDEVLYPKDAIYGTAYVFLDRCYFHLDRVADQRVKVRMRAKSGSGADDVLAGEFGNELLAQAWRRNISDENRLLIEATTTRAITGAAGPPGLDDLLAMDIGDDTAFEDPLGIAMSWEEKYKKKGQAKEAKDSAGEPGPAAPPSPLSPEGSGTP